MARRIISTITVLALALFVLSSLASCTHNQLVDDNGTMVQPPADDGNVRPDIPRTEPPTNTPPLVPVDQGHAAIVRSFLNASLYAKTLPHGLMIGDDDHPFLFNMTIGDILPVAGRHELPVLAAPMPVWQDRTLRAEQLIRFDFGNNTTGRLIMTRDKKTDAVIDELLFARGKPMFEYAYLLYDGAFPALINQELPFFGHTYQVRTATNTTIELYGKDVEQYLTLVNDSALMVNGRSFSDTHVEVDPWSVIITYTTPRIDPDGIIILPGQTLRDKLKNSSMLLNPAFDIAYDGIERPPNASLFLESYGDTMGATFHNLAGEELSLDLIGTSYDSFRWGGDDPLHVRECASDQYCVAPFDRFLLLSRSGVSRVLQFRGVRPLGESASFQDLATGDELVVKLVDTRRNESVHRILDGTISADDTVYDVRVIFNESPERGGSRLRVDMDGDGAIDGQKVPLVLLGGHELKFINASAGSLTFVSPRLNELEEEDLPISVSGNDLLLSIGNVTLNQIEDERTYVGASGRGVLVTLDESTDGRTGETLTLDYPPDYRAGLVRILG